MDVYMDIHDMIGNTPILKLNHFGVKEGVNIYAKLELYNPAGSVKDRIGEYMIKDAEERGILKPGGTIVDATAGNTGIGKPGIRGKNRTNKHGYCHEQCADHCA